MLSKGKISKQLLASYITGNCSAADKRRVEQWIAASPKNAELFEQYKAVWAFTAPVQVFPSFNAGLALEKTNILVGRAEETPATAVPKTKVRSLSVIYRYAAGIAAVLLLAIGLNFYLKTEVPAPLATYTTETKTSDPLQLSDGTEVHLNAGTTLSYPEKFSGNERQVILTGEAFFEVAHDPSHPFVITTGNLGIRVLGTSFNVNAADHLQTVEVTIQSGKVLFYSFDPETKEIIEQIVLNAGEKGIYNKEDNSMARVVAENHNCLAWVTGRLEFENAPLPEVLQAIERAYGLDFICKRDFGHLHLTARFDQEDPENIVETLKLIFGFRIEKTGSQITIF